MSIESDFVALLLSSSNVTDLVDDRLYTQVAPEDAAMPCMVYRMTSSIGEKTLSGHIISQDIRAQVWLLAESYGGIIQLKSAVMALSGQGNGDIGRIYIDEGPDNYEFEDRLYSKILDVEII